MPQPPDIRVVDAPAESEIAIVQAFVRADAQSAASARSLTVLGLGMTPALVSLEARGLLCRASADGWYLSVDRYTARRFRRRVMVIGATVVIVLLASLLARAL